MKNGDTHHFPDGNFCYGKLPYGLREAIRAQNIKTIEDSKSARSKRDQAPPDNPARFPLGQIHPPGSLCPPD